MKKILILMLSVMLLLSFSACKKNTQETSEGDSVRVIKLFPGGDNSSSEEQIKEPAKEEDSQISSPEGTTSKPQVILDEKTGVGTELDPITEPAPGTTQDAPAQPADGGNAGNTGKKQESKESKTTPKSYDLGWDTDL